MTTVGYQRYIQKSCRFLDIFFDSWKSITRCNPGLMADVATILFSILWVIVYSEIWAVTFNVEGNISKDDFRDDVDCNGVGAATDPLRDDTFEVVRPALTSPVVPDTDKESTLTVEPLRDGDDDTIDFLRVGDDNSNEPLRDGDDDAIDFLRVGDDNSNEPLRDGDDDTIDFLRVGDDDSNELLGDGDGEKVVLLSDGEDISDELLRENDATNNVL